MTLSDDDGRSSTGRPAYQGDLAQVTLVRLEAKIDGFNAKMDAQSQMQSMRHDALTGDIKHIRETQLTTASDHESRIRTLEQKSVDPARVHSLEQRRYVEPKTVWAAFTLFATLATITIAIINIIVK